MRSMSLHALRVMPSGIPRKGIIQGGRIREGDPILSIITSVIEPCVQGCQKGNRLIGSIGSIV